jgi:hypothetical protein
MKKLLFYFLAGTLVFSACKKDEEEPAPTTPTTPSTPADKTKPTVTISSPTANQEFMQGDDVTVTANAKDETELASYKVMLMDASGNEVGMADGTVTGKDANISGTISIDADAAEGDYEVHMTATDKAGNESDHAMVTIKVKKSAPADTEDPKVNSIAFGSIPASGKLESTLDHQIVIDASDNVGIVSIMVEIINKDDSDKVWGTKTETLDPAEAAFNGTITVRAGNCNCISASGQIKVTVTDAAGNTAVGTKDVLWSS